METSPAVTFKMLRDGTPVAVTTEGRDIPASELKPGMERWNSAMAFWMTVEKVGKVDRWGKINVVQNGSGCHFGCRVRADATVRVR